MYPFVDTQKHPMDSDPGRLADTRCPWVVGLGGSRFTEPSGPEVATRADGRRAGRLSRWLPAVLLAWGLMDPKAMASGEASGPARRGSRLSEPFLNGIWTERDGLPSGMILDLARSPEGLLWLVTEEGLRAFDGKRFTVPAEGLDELGAARMDRVFCDGEGRPWSCGGGVIRGFRTNSAGRYRKREWAGTDLAKDGLGWVWWRNGAQVHGRFGDLEAELPPEPEELSPVALLPGLWGARAGGVYRVDQRGDLRRGTLQGWTRIPGPLTSGAAVRRCEVFDDPTGRLWMSILTGSDESFLFVRDRGGWRIPTVSGSARPAPARCFVATGRGEILIGAERGLLYLSSGEDSDLQVFAGDPDGRPIRAIHEDPMGNWWVASEGPTLRLIRRDPNQLLVPGPSGPLSDVGAPRRPIARPVEPRQPFPVQSVAVDSRGRLWAAAGHRGLFVREGDHLVSPTPVPDALRGGVPVMALADSPRGLVVGGECLLMVLDEDGRGRAGLDLSGSVGQGSVVALAVDALGVIWAGTDSGQLISLAPEAARPSILEAGGPVSDLAAQGDRLWVLAGDILRCRSRDSWVTPPAGLEAIGKPRCLSADGRGRLMVVGRFGVAVIEGDRVSILGPRQGVFPDPDSSGFQDRRSGLWLASEDGLLQLDSHGLESELAARSAGDSPPASRDRLGRVMPLSVLSEIWPTTHRAGEPIALSSGEIAIPSSKGVLLVPLDSPGSAGDAVAGGGRPAYRVGAIRTVKSQGAGGAMLLTNLCVPEEAELEVSLQGNLVANLQPPPLRYSISQRDDAWIPWCADAPIRLVHPARASFPLRLQCKEPGGGWIEGKPSWIEVERSAGLSAAARGALLGGFVVMSGLLVWQCYRSAHQRRQIRARALEGMQNDRVRIARSLHDDLGNRLSEIQLLTEQATFLIAPDDPVIPLVDRVRSRSVEATVALDSMVWLMRDVSESATGFARHLERLARDYLEVCSVELEFKVLADPDLEIGGWTRQLIIAATQELTRNAVRHGRATRVSIEFKVGSDRVSYRVEDNGRGFIVEQALATGRGLSGLASRVEDSGGKVSVVSKPAGSVILFLLPKTSSFRP